MTGPDNGGIDVELAALRADAEVWRAGIAALEQPRRELALALVEPAAFSMWAVDAGVDRTYEDVRARMGRLIDQGSAAFRAIADALGAAADVYEREDAAGAHGFDALRPGGG
ncbi:hypothetical protein Acsp06_31610 [Actinomycetospora sp. NBRC 106375]|uniref:hypothetical protein n=1 Tax=Actinomycetospora sp. NBRC 106375 TaxID=3032207 RepID=UPI0024A25B8A|nr:hypothetical protein [Actinomycetospora sp. NBRC 106375]GLZ46976.1 hypothetical protein Acsp06_31610 [Actinomycetospora sp. NBRC 106375]